MAKFNLENKVLPKIYLNVGALLDIPTGLVTTGFKGETIINGGLGPITGVTGPGNNFKSSIMHYMMLSAADRIKEANIDTEMITYDTEGNVQLERFDYLASKFDNLPDDITSNEETSWHVYDKGSISANAWFAKMVEYTNEKAKDKKDDVVFECFKNPYNQKPLVIKRPTFCEIDSLTEFSPESVEDQLEGDLDSSDTNTFAMKQGLFKTKMISKLTSIATNSSTYFLMSAHIGTKVDMATGPAKYNQPTKSLQFLKSADTIKGATGKFTFLTHNSWFTHSASLLNNQTTKLAEYPRNKDDNMPTDLNIVKLTQLRGKNGGSGYTLEIVVSQKDGVLPSLTEFHYIKENGRFGIEGSNISYHLDLLPDVSLSRTTIREKLDTNPMLRRAVNITAELLQCKNFYPWVHTEDLICTPKELYDDIKKLGYDWNILLNTRGYYTANQYSNKVPFLSIIDLLKMRKGLYTPYFLNDDKTLKAEYAK